MINISSSFRIVIASLIIYQAVAQVCGDCEEAHESWGCSDLGCQNQVCLIDPFCCEPESNWDSSCAKLAIEGDIERGFYGCYGCCGNCGEVHGGSACTSLGCAEMVCYMMPDAAGCCDFTSPTGSGFWDSSCAAHAKSGIIGGCEACYEAVAPPQDECGNCGEVHDGHGCTNHDCELAVCAYIETSYCCVEGWDWGLHCADVATGNDPLAPFAGCSSCTSTPPQDECGNCDEAHFGSGCTNQMCAEMVCGMYPNCCPSPTAIGIWDSFCAEYAKVFCEACSGQPPPTNQPPECVSDQCLDYMCIYPECCQRWDPVSWDPVCNEIVSGCAFGPISDCEGCGPPACVNWECRQAVNTVDPICSCNEWGDMCTELAYGFYGDIIGCELCSGPPPPHMGPIDPWFIQRSVYPAPDVTNADPIEAYLWMELHPARINDGLSNVLTGEVHLLPAVQGQPCEEGQLVEAALFSATGCQGGMLPDGSQCPDPQNEGVLVLQSLTIPAPFNIPGLYSSPSNPGGNGQFQFCVHSELVLDYERRVLEDANLDSVSFMDTYFVIEVDFTTGFVVNVATFEREPPKIEAFFDNLLVSPYLCEDGNVPGTMINDPIPAGTGHIVGENFRVCILSDHVNLRAKSFNDVKCWNRVQSRLVIEAGNVPFKEYELTTIFPTDHWGVLAFESVVTTGLAANAPSTFECEGTVELGVKPSTNRRLQELGEEIPETQTGSFKVFVTVLPNDEGLSTAAIIGISMGAFVILVAMFTLYRRGCFEKKTTAVPKTVMTVEENSETSGTDGQEPF